MNPIKVIFLDMDGVMNSCQSNYWYRRMLGHEEDIWVAYRTEENEDTLSGYEKQLCPLACGNLRHLFEYHPDIRIVISSTWRKGRPVDKFNAIFKYFKIFKEDKVIDKTPVLNTERGYEIQEWLKNTQYLVEDFIIIDDDNDMGPYLDTYHFIRIDNKVGFDYMAMEKADKVFGKFTLNFNDLQFNKFYKMYGKPRSTNYFRQGDGMFYHDKDGDVRGPVYNPPNELFSEVIGV